MTNEITITMNKSYLVGINNQIPFHAKSFSSVMDILSGKEFNMIRFEFDNRCYSDAPAKVFQRGYNTYMNRINKFASSLEMEVAIVEEKVISGYVMKNQYTAVLVK